MPVAKVVADTKKRVVSVSEIGRVTSSSRLKGNWWSSYSCLSSNDMAVLSLLVIVFMHCVVVSS